MKRRTGQAEMQWNQKRRKDYSTTVELRNEGPLPKLAWKRFRTFKDRFARAKLSQITGLIFFLGMCLFSLISLFLVLSWYKPVEKQRWVIVTENYMQNLIVDQTVPAARSGILLADMLKSSGKNLISPENIGLIPENEVEIRQLMEMKPDNLKNISDESQSGILLYQFFCHGLSDEKGPYLLIDWLSGRQGFNIPQETDKVRVLALLESLVKIARGKPLVVLFDTEHALEFKHLGIIDNQFSEKVQELQPFIESHPNLTVILSTARDEISQTDYMVNESLFGRAFRKNLESSPNLGESFSLASLFDKVSSEVIREAGANYHVPQHPILLPSGATGRQRAEKVILRSIKQPGTRNGIISAKSKINDSSKQQGLQDSTDSADKTSVEVDGQISSYQKTELSTIWESYNRLSKINPPPYWNYPNKWKMYKAAITRYEELILIEEYSEANSVYSIIQRLVQELEQPIVMPRYLINGSMSLMEKYYFYTNRFQPEWLKSEFEKAWADSDPNVEKSIAKLVSRLGTLPAISNPEFQLTSENAVSLQHNIKLESASDSELQSKSTQMDKSVEKSSKNEKAVGQLSNLINRFGLSGDNSTSGKNKNQKGSNEQTKDAEKNGSPPISSDTQKTLENKDGQNDAGSEIKKPDEQGTQETKTEENKKDTITKSGNADEILDYQRYWIYQMISEKLMSYDTEIVDRAVRWLKILKPANEILPIELHLVALMHKDINTLGISNPSSTQNAPFNELIRSCLVFSRAANDTSEKNSYRHLFFNHAFFWFYPQILKADEYFLKGWDKFFSLNPDDRQRSFGDLANANNLYAQVMLNAIEIQKNMKSYIYALDRLHEISSWVAFDLINFSDKNRINSNLSSKMKLVSDSWKSIDEFTSLLQFESDYQQDAQSRQELLKRMTILNNQIMDVLKQLEDFYQLRSESIINKSYSSNVELSDLRSIHHALSIVGNDASMRKRLFDSYQQIKLQSGKSVANSNNDQSRLKNSVFSEFLQINSELTRWMYRSLLEKSENGFVNTLPSRSDQSLPAKSQPESSFVNFNSFLGLLNQHLIKLTNDNELKKEQPDFRYLWENERFIRLIPLVLAEDVKDHISRIYITKTNSHHLRLSSQRLWNMHWGPIEQTDPPYYKVLGEICLQHAENSNRELAIDTKMIQQIRKEYKESSNPEIVIQPILRVAGSSELSIPFEITPGKNLDSLNVNATTWLDGDQVLRSTFNSFKTANLNLLGGANSLKLEDRLWETSESKNDSDISEYQTGIEVGLLFRGNHLKNRSQLIVYRQPTWSDVRPLPVAGGSIALQTEKNIIGKYGKSGGSVCFVLDCSGSMGVGSGTEWSDAAKYAQAVKSVLDTIKQLPKDTEITIWVFGESVGTERNAADSKTIRQVIKSLKWNPDDSRIYDEIKLRISYPECIPWNRSPIVESMRKAASDLVNNRGPRMMVVITDGQDTGLNDTLDTDPKQKNVKIRNNNELIADKIRAIFSTTDISVNVIGFKLAREEAQSIQDQFSVVQDLPTPGVYTSIDKEGELSALMNSVLRRKLYYRIDSEYNDKIREEAIEGVEFQTPGITDRWINPSLDAGIYKIWSDLGRRISSRFSISNGRRLLLELKEDDNGTPVFQKKKWLSSSFPFRPAVVSKDWRFTWIASKSSTDQLKILAGIENEREFQPDSIIEMIEPGDLDIKVTEKDHQTKLLSGSMRRLWNYQSPVWEINLNKYKQNIGNPAMFLEIQDSNQFNSVLNLRKKIEFQEIGEIVNKRFSYEGNQILVKSAGIQERWLQDQFNGEKLTKQKCFVIRIEHDAGRRIRPDVVFTRNIFHNKSYRYYEPAGVSETIIWCDSTQQNDINNLNVDSVSFTALNAIDSKDSSRIRMSLGDKMKIPLRGDIWPDPVLTEQVPSGLEKTSDKSDSNKTELPSALEKPK